MAKVFLGLGSNIGNKEKNIYDALTLLSDFCTIKKMSHIYLTEPVGEIKQDWFLNCCAEIETKLAPEKLLTRIKAIEKKLGRTKTVKNGPRCIDIDILFYDDAVVKTKDLTIPHPGIEERLFVLRPLLDLDPKFIHPVKKLSIQEMYQSHPWLEKVLFYK